MNYVSGLCPRTLFLALPSRGVGKGGGSEGSDEPPFLGANFIHNLYKVLWKRSVQKQPFKKVTFKTTPPLKKSFLHPCLRSFLIVSMLNLHRDTPICIRYLLSWGIIFPFFSFVLWECGGGGMFPPPLSSQIIRSTSTIQLIS